MQWVRAAGGVALTFIGVWNVFNGLARALEPRLVTLFWANQEKYTQRKKEAKC
ncbi:hypothetical protein JTF08_13800 [Micrococcaceae bacterium RIT802]|nr:hypothetical protein [Micrococcaceae bacterium RIT 802]